MKKWGLHVVSFVLFTLASGCDAIKNATDVNFILVYNYVFAVDANLATHSYDIDLTTNPEYAKYRGKIKEVSIEYLRYSVTSNTGNGGKAAVHVNTIGGGLATAKKVAETITLAAGETRGVTDVAWLNKAYFENLLLDGHLSVWGIAEGSGVRLTLPVELQLKVTTNPLD
jgi:hypothetical protein